MPDRCEFICVTSSGRPSCRRREPPDRRAFVPKRGILFRKENTPFVFTVRSTAYFPRCRAAQKMPDGSSLAADAAAARMPCISRLRPLPSAALLIFRAAVQRKKCRMAARSPLTRQPLVCPCISRLRPLPSAALLIFRAAVQRKKCRMAARSPLTRQPLVCHVSADCVRYRPQHCLFSALPRSAKNAGWQLARRWRGNRSYATYQQAASVTVRSTAYTFFRCRRGRGRCGRSSAPCAAAFLRCRRPQWWRRCPRPRARA